MFEVVKHGFFRKISTERYRISQRAADPEDRVKNREPMELRRTLPSSLSLPKQQ
jgi:hypothetical protein